MSESASTPTPDPARSVTFAVVAHAPVPDTYGVIDCEVERIDPATARPAPGIRIVVRTADPGLLGMLTVGNVVRIDLVDRVGDRAQPDPEG